ncbi:MmgE/PrpD family protein [Aeromicrobium tamlense]|uniref:2-methylcitrate dehydratase PrpD n=1 Tax=Aeromicrobium tamlense TaxID=375541 RepID=A0A8I0FVM2_9ACTN|nr:MULTISPECIES: MmgE/PrpD family protein [Aeromicrobium]MBD1269463.1 MmgE/PrpD family protein [Aeromicrobium tamlense]NYI36628.1 2-methylcitrate dehydratase PrpD [Aeromicrobium tamlense]
MTDPLKKMSDWAAGLRWEDVPSAVRERAADALSDTVSTMVGGAVTGSAGIAAKVTGRTAGPSPVVGRGQGSSPTMAAFANGVAASALDFDDGHYLAGAIHPGSVIVPAVLAAATSGTTVAEALTAQVVGYEIGLRAAHLLWPKHDGDHYHCTGCAGAIGAAAAAAKVSGADADEIERAVKIGWLHAPMATFGSPMVKESIGWGAATGVMAAELAAAGFMSLPEGYALADNDVLPATPFHQPGAAEDPFVTSIGEVYETGNTYFKSFAACRYTHAAAAGFRGLLAEHAITPERIARVRVGTHQAATFLDELRPGTIDSAQYSFPFVLASIALHGAAGAAEMDESVLAEPERLDLASRVVLEHDADLDQHYPARYPSRVTIETTDGASVDGVFLDAPGDPGTDFGRAELQEKWRLLLTPALGEQSDRVLAGLRDDDALVLDASAPAWEAWA